MSTDHTFVLKVEDGYTSWRIICPDDGGPCNPAAVCGACGRSTEDTEAKPCYDCPASPAEGCWVQSWVGNLLAEEVLHGTVEVRFPVVCQWTGDALECHVNGPAAAGHRGRPR